MSTRAEGESAVTIARLRAELAATARRVRDQEVLLATRRLAFERAASAARIGMWDCILSTSELDWTSGVYDLFDLRRGSPIRREQTLEFYSDASRRELDLRRGQAIRDGTGFTLDAEIRSLRGESRWMRITASVACHRGVPVRLFGVKQDITEDKLLHDRARLLAETDGLTGLANRSAFEIRLAAAGGSGSEEKRLGALLLVDLDGFKQVNDTYGHALGDECLKEVAARLTLICRGAELVSRIGGDEFAILLGAPLGPGATEALARAIVHGIGAPIDRGGHRFAVGASVGIAPIRDGALSESFRQADSALYAAKASGRNAFRVFDPLTMRMEARSRFALAAPLVVAETVALTSTC